MNVIAERIYTSILSDISSGKLLPGSRLPTETRLSEEFETNRMNAHYAVKQLEVDGVVTRNKKQGSLINSDLSRDFILDLRNLYNNRVYILASLSEAKNIHWNESTIMDLEQTLGAARYSVTLIDLPFDKSGFRDCFLEIMKTGSRAVFIMPDQNEAHFILDNLDVLDEYHGDIYLLNRGVATFHRAPCHILSLDPFDEGVIAGKYIFEKGFRDIIFAGALYREGCFWQEERKDGVCLGVDIASKGKTKPVVIVEPRSKLFDNLADELRNAKNKPAVIAQNDKFAVELIGEMKKRGFDMPNDYCLMGFGNVFLYRKHDLTTIAPPIEKIGKTFAGMMLNKEWRRSNGAWLNLKLKSSIVERSSTSN